MTVQSVLVGEERYTEWSGDARNMPGCGLGRVPYCAVDGRLRARERILVIFILSIVFRVCRRFALFSGCWLERDTQ